jgi:hypothetical protein
LSGPAQTVREPDATQMRSSYRVCRCSGVIEPAGSQLSVKSWRPPVSAPVVRMVTRTRSGPRTNWRSRRSGLVVVMVAPPLGIVGIDPSLAGREPVWLALGARWLTIRAWLPSVLSRWCVDGLLVSRNGRHI